MTRPKWKRRLAWFAGGLAVTALVLFGIFGGGKAPTRILAKPSPLYCSQAALTLPPSSTPDPPKS